MSSSDESMLDVARGDVARSRHLRNCLTVLRDNSDDGSFRRLVDDVLDGRRALREAYGSPEFQQTLGPLVQRFASRYNQMSDDEREQLASRGDRDMGRLRLRMEQGHGPE